MGWVSGESSTIPLSELMGNMKKSDRMEAFVKTLSTDEKTPLDPCYLGYFECFNQHRYYEAHDVLEHLWLKHRDQNYAFYKGLIQIAGAYVHLQKQYYRPHHHKDGKRLAPAARLFLTGKKNVETYGKWHLGLDVESVCRLCDQMAGIIAKKQENPWRPERAPHLKVSAPGH